MPDRRAILWFLAWLACLSCTFAFAATSENDDAVAPTLRIPAGARPTHYAVTLTVIPGRPDVAGEITIDVELADPHSLLWLNASAVKILAVAVDGARDRGRVQGGNDEFVGIAFDPPLPAGMHQLRLTFVARQNRNSARGIFTLQDAGA